MNITLQYAIPSINISFDLEACLSTQVSGFYMYAAMEKFPHGEFVIATLLEKHIRDGGRSLSGMPLVAAAFDWKRISDVQRETLFKNGFGWLRHGPGMTCITQYAKATDELAMLDLLALATLLNTIRYYHDVWVKPQCAIGLQGMQRSDILNGMPMAMLYSHAMENLLMNVRHTSGAQRLARAPISYRVVQDSDILDIQYEVSFPSPWGSFKFFVRCIDFEISFMLPFGVYKALRNCFKEDLTDHIGGLSPLDFSAN